MTANRTHRTRLARALTAVADIGYQAALTRVVRAAEAGLLPDPLDAPGMRYALDVLLAGTNPAAADSAADGRRCGWNRATTGWPRSATPGCSQASPGVLPGPAPSAWPQCPAGATTTRSRPSARSWPTPTTRTPAATGGGGSCTPVPDRTAP